MKRRRTLITSPLKWQMTVAPMPPPAIPVLAERGGTQLKTPRPTVLVDTREQNPFDFSRFEAWFSGIERTALKLGDYSIAGLEDLCVVERKDLSDLVHSFTAERSVFVNRRHGQRSWVQQPTYNSPGDKASLPMRRTGIIEKSFARFRGSPAGGAGAWDGASCAGPWPLSAGCARA